jgi:nitrous oxidase accessory protein NosD
MRALVRFLTFSGVLFCTSSSMASVRTWVATFGSDTNPCTRIAPCRSFAAAIAAVSSGGEVVVLDSGGYGAVTIAKSVTLVAPAGVHAAVAPTAGSAIVVNPATPQAIVLRGLYLNSQGASHGIEIIDDAAVFVEHCVISGFTLDGVRASADGAAVRVKDSTVRQNGRYGLYFEAPITAIRALLDGVTSEGNSYGVTAGPRADVTVANSMAAGNATRGFSAEATSSILALENSTTTQNGVGIYSAGTARVSRSTIVGNATGVSIATGAQALTFGNNFLAGNSTDGTFTTPVLPLN